MTKITIPEGPPCPLKSRHVAVIGAGAAGLVAARELVREGHRVVVFERGDQVGGTWVYTPEVESDPLGLDPHRTVVHSSLYESLRTNLPREMMGFLDFPFVAKKDDKERDPRRFPGHREVLMYLKDFAREFGIEDLVRFQTEVVYAGLAESTGNVSKWKVKSKTRSGDNNDQVEVDDIFDAVVVCNGHYTEPRVAEIPGIEAWPGKQIHSHSYRTPEPYRDKVVVLIGSSASSIDISRDIARVAREVHVASRSIADEKIGKQPCHDNMWLHSMIKSVHGDGSVVFHDESVVFADVILHCTGYKFHYPFLETNGIVTVDDSSVGPLYKHVFPPALAPWLSFVGLPKVIPFSIAELQSKWIAGILSNRITLPSKDDMMEDVNAFYSMLEASGTPKRYTHDLTNSIRYEYADWFAVQCGCPVYEEWRKEMFFAVSKRKLTNKLETYRDEWDDDQDLILQAHRDFKKYLPNEINKLISS